MSSDDSRKQRMFGTEGNGVSIAQGWNMDRVNLLLAAVLPCVAACGNYEIDVGDSEEVTPIVGPQDPVGGDGEDDDTPAVEVAARVCSTERYDAESGEMMFQQTNRYSENGDIVTRRNLPRLQTTTNTDVTQTQLATAADDTEHRDKGRHGKCMNATMSLRQVVNQPQRVLCSIKV